MTKHIANREQAEAWDGHQGDHWVDYADHYDTLMQRVTPHLMEAAAVGTSDRVLDVGCGSGSTTRSAARAARSGSALGVDLSAAMLRDAEQRAHGEGIDNVRFEQADVQVHAFAPAAFDLAISRFGVMFFEDPLSAFTNIASGLRPGGRFVFVCWQERDPNEWVTIPVGAALTVVPPPDRRPEDAPGAFSLAKPDRIRQLLTDAGLVDVEISEVAERILLGASAAEAVDFWQGTGTARALLDGVDAETERRAVDAVGAALRPHESPGGIWLDSAAWLVTAARA
jgi:SAM-dependent methyltransferase